MKYFITVDGHEIEQIELAGPLHHIAAQKVCYEWAKQRHISEKGVWLV